MPTITHILIISVVRRSQISPDAGLKVTYTVKSVPVYDTDKGPREALYLATGKKDRPVEETNLSVEQMRALYVGLMDDVFVTRLGIPMQRRALSADRFDHEELFLDLFNVYFPNKVPELSPGNAKFRIIDYIGRGRQIL